MRRTFVFLGSRRPRPLTSGNAHAFRCNFSKWRTGQRERLKNQSDFATNTQHTPPLKRSIHEKGIQNCMILKSRRLTNPTRDWKFTILATALASMSGDPSGAMKDLNIFRSFVKNTIISLSTVSWNKEKALVWAARGPCTSAQSRFRSAVTEALKQF